MSIHFPTKPQDQTNSSTPWYWYFDFQQPQYFSFLFKGWLRLPDFTIIKILQIDPRQPIPVPPVGFNSLEQAVRAGNPDVTFGRFDFKDDRFWTLIGSPKPKFNEVRGKIEARDTKTNINAIIKKAVQGFGTSWNGEANTYNKIAAGVGANGFHYPGQPSLFKLPLPDGPPTTVSRFNSQLSGFLSTPPGSGAAFLGPVPSSAFFNINTNTTQAYAFTLKVAQLDPRAWNMGVFPPVPAPPPTVKGLTLDSDASAASGDYSGFGATPFIIAGPQLV